MPLLLADLIYSRDCKLNLRKNVDTTHAGRKNPNVVKKFPIQKRKPLKFKDLSGFSGADRQIRTADLILTN